MCVVQLSSSVVAEMCMAVSSDLFGSLDLVIFLLNGPAFNQCLLSSICVLASNHTFQFAISG